VGGPERVQHEDKFCSAAALPLPGGAAVFDPGAVEPLQNTKKCEKGNLSDANLHLTYLMTNAKVIRVNMPRQIFPAQTLPCGPSGQDGPKDISVNKDPPDHVNQYE
jgi:hypothetical protein